MGLRALELCNCMLMLIDELTLVVLKACPSKEQPLASGFDLMFVYKLERLISIFG